ncbi:MAG TPA: ABC transporter permease [Puia sp.]|nr:ABC transporter permease [Puia sp.]
MFKNYFKTAWRNLRKNSFYSLINIAGLTLGLAIGILILLWVSDELSFDAFHHNASHIYRLEIRGGTGTSKQIFTVGVAPIGPLAKQQLPDVMDQVRLTGNYNYSLYKYNQKVFGDENAVFADPSFFSVFDFPLIKGNVTRPFPHDNSVVITRKTAEKFFGTTDPMGKVIVADNKQDFIVSGVIADFPKNSSLQSDMIMPMEFHLKAMRSGGMDMSDNFSYLDYETYLTLKPGTSLNALSTKILQIHLKHKPDDTDADYLLLPLAKMHLYNADMSDRGIATVRIFIVIALLILLIACINYVNLSTARAMLRAKEISVRKIVGAGKTQLFLQFILETAMLFSLSVVLAIGLVDILMPVFNQVAGKQMALDLRDYHIWFTVLAAITGTLAASSIYPALLLSSFNPLKALKGKISIGVGDVMLRKILVVTQFGFSVMLIVSTIVITGQLHYMRTKDLGYDKNNVFSFWMRDMTTHFDAAKQELLHQPGILAVTRSNQNIIRFNGFTGALEWDGKDPKDNLIVHPIAIDKDLISFFKMKLLQGSSFSGAVNDTSHFILNEAAIKETGIKDPIGKRFVMNGVKGTIIGTVQDFHYASMREKIAPAVFFYAPQYLNKIYIKTTGQDAQKAIAAAGKQFKNYNGEYPFGYAFLDDVFNNIYSGEQQQGTLFTYFAMIAIFISCLGLLGLATYTAQVRKREIGIRKVLGAGIGNITAMLSAHFLKLVLIAILIASPVAWYAMNKWLQDFAYRIHMQWWVFAITGFLAILIAFATISFQAIKAAIANPVKSLRTE